MTATEVFRNEHQAILIGIAATEQEAAAIRKTTRGLRHWRGNRHGQPPAMGDGGDGR